MKHRVTFSVRKTYVVDVDTASCRNDDAFSMAQNLTHMAIETQSTELCFLGATTISGHHGFKIVRVFSDNLSREEIYTEKTLIGALALLKYIKVHNHIKDTHYEIFDNNGNTVEIPEE